MKFLTCLVTLFITALSQTMALAQEQRQNEIIVDPSYLQGHVSEVSQRQPLRPAAAAAAAHRKLRRV